MLNTNLYASIPPYMMVVVVIEAVVMVGIGLFIVMDTISQRKKAKQKEEEQKKAEEEARLQAEREKEIPIAEMERATRLASKEELSQLEFLERRAQAEMQYTDTMVKQAKAKEILDKLNKGETLTGEEKKFLEEYSSAPEETKTDITPDPERGKVIPDILIPKEEVPEEQANEEITEGTSPSSEKEETALNEENPSSKEEETQEEEIPSEEGNVPETALSEANEEPQDEPEDEVPEETEEEVPEEKETGFTFGGSALNVEEEDEAEDNGFFLKKKDEPDEPMDEIPDEVPEEKTEVITGSTEEEKITEIDEGYFFDRKEKESVTEKEEYISPSLDISETQAPEE